MHRRILNISDLLDKKSHFLFGARSTGKTTLIETTLKGVFIVDLLHARTYALLVRNPSHLEEMIPPSSSIVVIDEIQKLPQLLDEVHRLIQKKHLVFLLTGSSARKLKHGGANLLAGRAREARLFPLVSEEIKNFDLIRMLNHGGLPQIYDSTEPEEDLAAYIDTYLREEIKAEAVTRNITAFAEFLDACAVANGNEINYESFASDLQVSAGTLKNYLQVLEDTLLGFSLRGFTKTKKRKAITRSKHYLFDLGVTRYLSKTGRIEKGSKSFGDFFEHFIILEVRAFVHYFRKRLELSYWRSTSQFEVDLIIGEEIAVEIKSTEIPSDKHLKGLRALKEEGLCKSFFLVCTATHDRTTEDGIHILSWRSFLGQLWGGILL